MIKLTGDWLQLLHWKGTNFEERKTEVWLLISLSHQRTSVVFLDPFNTSVTCTFISSNAFWYNAVYDQLINNLLRF